MRFHVSCKIALFVLLLASRSFGDETPKKTSSANPQPAAKGAKADDPAAGLPVVSFRRQVAPILVEQCLACHGQDDPEGEFQLFDFEHLLKRGVSGTPSITPGSAAQSELFLRLCEKDEDRRMPSEADPLPAAQVQLIQHWIDQGAKFDGKDVKTPLASLIPRRAHPDPPETYRRPLPITALAFSPDGSELAVSGYHEVIVLHTADGSLARRIRDVDQRVYGLSYSSDGSLLAVAAGTPGSSGEIGLYRADNGQLVRSLATMADVALGVEFSPDGKRLAGCSADRTVRIFDVAGGEQQVLIEDHADWVLDVAFNHDGSRLATASRDKTAKIFDTATGESLATFRGHGDVVFAVAFKPDGKAVFSAGRDKRVRIWNPADGKQIAEIGGFGRDIYDLLLADGQVFTASADRIVRQHDAETRKLVRNYSGHADWVFSLAYLGANHLLASGGYDGEVRLWNTEDGSLVRGLIAAPGHF